MNDMATDHVGGQAFTYKALRRAWKSLPGQGKPMYEEWVGAFFTRVFFVRVMWTLRKNDRKKYWRIVRADWKAITGPWIRHRKMWRKHMAGYSHARAGQGGTNEC